MKTIAFSIESASWKSAEPGRYATARRGRSSVTVVGEAAGLAPGPYEGGPSSADRVAYLVLGTHSRKLDGDLIDLFHREGWTLEHEKPSQFTCVPRANAREHEHRGRYTGVVKSTTLLG